MKTKEIYGIFAEYSWIFGETPDEQKGLQLLIIWYNSKITWILVKKWVNMFNLDVNI